MLENMPSAKKVKSNFPAKSGTACVDTHKHPCTNCALGISWFPAHLSKSATGLVRYVPSDGNTTAKNMLCTVSIKGATVFYLSRGESLLEHLKLLGLNLSREIQPVPH